MSIDFSQQRIKMVDSQLRTTDVTSVPVLEAFLEIPRERFVGSASPALAYIDEDIPVARTSQGPRYLMEPSPLARLIQLADVGKSDVALDVGCGTGYGSAILARLAQSVVALESDSHLAEQASATMAELGCSNVEVVTGQLSDGHATRAPYDVILINGSVEEVPQTLFDQLEEGGRLVAVEGRGNAGTARLFIKTEGVVTGRRAFNAAIKPLPGFERARIFEF